MPYSSLFPPKNLPMTLGRGFSFLLCRLAIEGVEENWLIGEEGTLYCVDVPILVRSVLLESLGLVGLKDSGRTRRDSPRLLSLSLLLILPKSEGFEEDFLMGARDELDRSEDRDRFPTEVEALDDPEPVLLCP